jgi:iron complex outermembrane recepter protein
MKHQSLIRVIAVLTGLSTAPSSFAQIEEIVVTATKRSESVQSMPIAINAISGDALDEMGVDNIIGTKL